MAKASKKTSGGRKSIKGKAAKEPIISVKINESARIDSPEAIGERNTEAKSEKPEKASGKPTSYLTYAAVGFTLILIVGLIFIFTQTPIKPDGNQTYKFPQLSNDTMVCGDDYLCFMQNGTWYKIGYNAGTNLTLANRLQVSNEDSIKGFFNGNPINIIFGASQNADPANALLITTATPFTYYLGLYFAYEKENKTITPYLLSEYNFTEPALVILGPGMGANETSLKFDGKNVVVQGESFSDLGMVLGKLLIIVVKQ